MQPDVAAQGLCRSFDDPDVMFVTGAAQNDVKQFCFDCPIRMSCLAEALDTRTEFGVWGGMTERERRAVLNKHPNVPSWAALLIPA
jgi:WhiB family redox-sensing transcriptional regulator